MGSADIFQKVLKKGVGRPPSPYLGPLAPGPQANRPSIHTCRRFFFQGGGKMTPSRLSHFYQPDFPIFPTFWDKKTQPSFLAVFGSRGGGVKYPWMSFLPKLAQKCLKLFLSLLHLTQHGSIRSGGNILLFILKLMLKFLICFGELLCIV